MKRNRRRSNSVWNNPVGPTPINPTWMPLSAQRLMPEIRYQWAKDAEALKFETIISAVVLKARSAEVVTNKMFEHFDPRSLRHPYSWTYMLTEVKYPRPEDKSWQCKHVSMIISKVGEAIVYYGHDKMDDHEAQVLYLLLNSTSFGGFARDFTNYVSALWDYAQTLLPYRLTKDGRFNPSALIT